ncbi:C40 family peptidase [Aestuariicella hydrocarbonica]|uniref:C40 family peptidase n=1 Tax=Pseudomaricurvus hydrocarbonicus TaxID=1470433 RepID=A0A9E5MLI6_9GAMM|nr:NlpC/P60 family protein [Aestuariicella hydrocarbonica]NHO64613.1 C40 family peptidase [Aestuariicella hydrocarbonica]
MKPIKLSDHARELMGVPFLHQGRNPAVGIDCAGMVSIAMQRFGVEHTDVKGYNRNPDGKTLKNHLDSQVNLRQIPFPVAECIILFRIKRDPQHVAIYDGNEIIHAYSTAKKVTSNPLDEWWMSRIVACYEVIQ